MDVERDRKRILAALGKAEAFARQCASGGPEYGDDDAPYCFFMAAQAVRSTAPLPGESVEAWCDRIRAALRETLKKNPSPAAHEAAAMIRPGA